MLSIDGVSLCFVFFPGFHKGGIESVSSIVDG
jgi:hypothetical protein